MSESTSVGFDFRVAGRITQLYLESDVPGRRPQAPRDILTRACPAPLQV